MSAEMYLRKVQLPRQLAPPPAPVPQDPGSSRRCHLLQHSHGVRLQLLNSRGVHHVRMWLSVAAPDNCCQNLYC